MPIMEISVIPVGTKATSISQYIADALEVLGKEKEIVYEITATGTIIEASSLEILLDMVKKIHKRALERGPGRVLTSLKIDDRTDKDLTIKRKVEAVKEKLSSSSL